jgi:hypothetical protein
VSGLRYLRPYSELIPKKKTIKKDEKEDTIKLKELQKNAF